MGIKTFSQFIQEAKIYEPKTKYNLWSDPNDAYEIENDDELVYSQTEIKLSNCKFNSLKKYLQTMDW